MQRQKHTGKTSKAAFKPQWDTNISTGIQAECDVHTGHIHIKHHIKNNICFYCTVWTACQLHHSPKQRKRDRAQLVSLINPNEVRLYYQKWLEQQVLLRAWPIQQGRQRETVQNRPWVSQWANQRALCHSSYTPFHQNPPNSQERTGQEGGSSYGSF